MHCGTLLSCQSVTTASWMEIADVCVHLVNDELEMRGKNQSHGHEILNVIDDSKKNYSYSLLM